MLLIHGPSSESVSSSCYFHCSSSSLRTTIHLQKFEYCFSKISLDPFRYSLKPSGSLKITPSCSQITVPFFFQSSDPPAPNSTQIATHEPKPPLNKLQLMLLLNPYSCQRSELGEMKMMMSMKTRSRRRRREEKMVTAKKRRRKKKKMVPARRRRK